MNHCKKLKQLDLTRVEISSSNMDTVIKNGNNLEIMSITDPIIDCSDEIGEFEEVQQFTNLTKLSLEGLWSSAYYSELAKVCFFLEDLMLLKIHFYEETSIESTSPLTVFIKNSRHTLKFLKISECEFNDCENFLLDLGNCKNLEKLNINDMKGTLTGQYILKFVSAISNLKNLTELEIRVCPEDVKRLFNSGCMKNLIKITLYNSGQGSSKITNEVIKAIDIGSPNVKDLGLYLFSEIEFENERIVFCKTCGSHGIYHLKNQNTCSNTHKILEVRNENEVKEKENSKKRKLPMKLSKQM